MVKGQVKPYPLRLPNELKNWVKNRAFSNRRSINTELNVLIEIAKAAVEKKELETNGQT